ncbi:MAG: adenine-specific DNA-methyltransferase [Sphaerospermopsis sp.]|nr:adenine-specific DNA-methyltransferase [Sphaerospermopsis sp.]
MISSMIQSYEQQGNIIFHGDTINVLKNHISSESVDLIIIDPPYNIGKKFGDFHDKWESEAEYLNWSYQWLDECVRILKPNGTIYVMSSTQAMPYFDIYLRKKLTILSRIIWHYDSSGVQAKKYFGSMYEPILYCVKDKNNYTFNADDIKIEAKTGSQRQLIDYRKSVPTAYNTEKVPGNVWYFSRVRYRMEEYENHPSQKPESLIERMMLASSNEGDLILDPFAGTFTTAAVAKRLGRKSISIELQEEYLKIGLRRVLAWTEYQGEKLL